MCHIHRPEGVHVLNIVIQPLLVLAAIQWVSHSALCIPSLSDHTFMSKVRCPCECNKSCNLLQFSLDSCIGICFPLVSFLSFRTDVGFKSMQNSQQIFVSGYLCLFPARQSSALAPFGLVVSSLLLQLSIASQNFSLSSGQEEISIDFICKSRQWNYTISLYCFFILSLIL